MFNGIIERSIKGFFSNPVKLRRIAIFIIDNLNDLVDSPVEQQAAASTLAGMVPEDLKKYVDEASILQAMQVVVPKINEWLQELEKKLRAADK